jgi:ribosomal-protein-alanine N-acetyltransferase
VTVRDATVSDLTEIAAIQAASPETSQWPPSDHLNCDCRVAIVSGRIVGFLTARQTAPGEREVLNLAVAPEHRRQGIARRLLQEELGRGTCFLEVRESNTAAIALYTSAGFQIVGRRPAYYEDPAEAGVVMRFFS